MKSERRAKILELIQSRPISTQGELQEALQEAGIQVTQATVSRDMRDLKLIKVLSPIGKYVYTVGAPVGDTVPNAPTAESLLAQTVLKVDYAGNMVVLKCRSAMAQAACATIDGLQLYQIVGTLAGEDTVFVLVRSEEQAKELAERLSSSL